MEFLGSPECLKVSYRLVKAGSPGFTFRKLLVKASELRNKVRELYIFMESEEYL